MICCCLRWAGDCVARWPAGPARQTCAARRQVAAIRHRTAAQLEQRCATVPATSYTDAIWSGRDGRWRLCRRGQGLQAAATPWHKIVQATPQRPTDDMPIASRSVVEVVEVRTGVQATCSKIRSTPSCLLEHGRPDKHARRQSVPQEMRHLSVMNITNTAAFCAIHGQGCCHVAARLRCIAEGNHECRETVSMQKRTCCMLRACFTPEQLVTIEF
eukprot:365345-Chlamydomonas_euryale.AAC.6